MKRHRLASSEETLESDAGLEPRQRGTNAQMRAESEGQELVVSDDVNPLLFAGEAAFLFGVGRR